MKFQDFAQAFKATQAASSTDGRFFQKKFSVKDETGSKALLFVMGISTKAPEGGTYSVSKIFRAKNDESSGQPVFAYQQQEGRYTVAEVVEYLGDAYVAVICDGSAELDAVYSLKDCLNGVFTTKVVNEKSYPNLVSGGMNLEERYKSKRDIAANLGLNPVWTVGEYKFAEKETAARIARESVEREAKSAKAIADKKASEEVRSAKIAALLQRPKAQAFTADGGKRFGIPIESEGEDEVLDMGTFCIRMQDGLPVEAYILRKNGSGRVTRENRTAVFASHAAVKAGSIDVSTEAENIPFDLDGNFGEASIFSSFAAVEEMRTKHGLNSGSIVGVRKGVEIQLYKVTKQVSKLVGTLEA